MENYQKLVSSRGILRSCDLHTRPPQSSSTVFDFGSNYVLRSGGSIYCCTDALENFARLVLEQITLPFVLVTGDADTVVAPESLGDEVFGRILSHPHLQRWYAQNLGASDEKLFFLPIGQDYHTMWERPEAWGDPVKRSAFEQERVLLEIRSRSAPLEKRKRTLYCNWHLSLARAGRLESPQRQARLDCLEQVDKSLCFLEPEFLPRYAAWERQAGFAFVLSPEGNGPDTHRLWEALALGCVPIVKRSLLAELYHDLPVLVVDDWREISAGFLEQSMASLCADRFDFSPLYLEHWRTMIGGAGHGGLPPMTLAESLTLL